MLEVAILMFENTIFEKMISVEAHPDITKAIPFSSRFHNTQKFYPLDIDDDPHLAFLVRKYPLILSSIAFLSNLPI